VRDYCKEFDWNMPMQPEQVAEVVPYIIAHKENIESGSRIIVVSSAMGIIPKIRKNYRFIMLTARKFLIRLF